MSVVDTAGFHVSSRKPALPRVGLLTSSAELGDARRERAQVLALIAVAGVCYFAAEYFRYRTFHAGALDLGVWDQTMYLISQRKTPFSTVLGIHMLADHGSLIIYFFAQLYRAYPTVCWLFLIQSGCIAGAAWPLWRLARFSGISPSMARALVVAYLLYPVVGIAAVRDFYPEVLVVPSLLAMILCARQERFGWFMFWLVLALSTKEVVALICILTGIYLASVERRRAFGIACSATSLIWFLLVTRLLVPHFGQGHAPDPTRFYRYLGQTEGQVIATIFLKPWIPLKVIFGKSLVVYAIAIAGPVIWALSWKKLGPLLCAVPYVFLLLLSAKEGFHNPLLHYSLLVVPFAFVSVIDTVAAGKSWFIRETGVVIWSVAVVTATFFTQVSFVGARQLAHVANDRDKPEMLSMITDQGGVIASHQMVPQLAHRQVVQFVFEASETAFHLPPDKEVEWVALDFAEDDMFNAGQTGIDLLHKYENDPAFETLYQKGSLYLFHRKGAGPVYQ